MTRWPRSLGAAAPALGLAVVALAPFLAKAFTIDDTLFLKQAEQLLRDPLHPTAFDMVWTNQPRRMSIIMPSGPAMAYLLVPTVAARGAEWLAHATELALLCLGLVATAGLALRLGLNEKVARWSALLCASAPAVLAMTGTAMPDVPAMAFGVAGLERLGAWREERRWHQALAASLLLAAAALSRSQAVLLGVVGLLWAVSRPARARDRLSHALPVFVAPVLVGLVVWVTRDPASGANAAASARHFASSRHLGDNLLAMLDHWALALPLVLPWTWLRLRWLPWRLGVVALPAAALLVLSKIHQGQRWPPLVVAAGVAALSILVFADILLDAWRRRDRLQACLGLWLLVPLPVVCYIHLPPKYLLVAAPAAALLLARAALAEGRTRMLWVSLGAGFGLGLLILRADARLAGFDRHAVAALLAPEIQKGRTVWFSGHWGFQWYAEQSGARPLTVTPPRPVPGDLLAVSRACGGSAEQIPKRRLLGVLADAAPGGRIMSQDDDAGFYSNSWGFLPWAWGRGELERVELWEIQ